MSEHTSKSEFDHDRSDENRAATRPAGTITDVESVLDDALAYAREHDYAGWDPYDGLNSPIVDAFARNWFLRLVGMHGVHKFPVNLRPLLQVPKMRNAKGIGLFATAYLDRYDADGDESDLRAAEELLDWLRENPSTESTHTSWGYNFDWQNSNKFFLPAEHPSIVASVFCASAFLRHHELTGDEESLEVAVDVCEFITEEINVVPVEGYDYDAYAYTPFDDYVVINANALGAGLLARVGDRIDDDDYRERAREVVDIVVDAQTEEGGWYYSIPSDQSHLSHDNFHTGFVLESLHNYLSAIDDEDAAAAYEKGLAFYREHLFEADGAPKFEHDSSYPRDVHGSAQAIRTLVVDGSEESLALAEQVIDWTVEELFDETGYFYRRKGRVLWDRTPYMRWNQAWMCYALATYLRHEA